MKSILKKLTAATVALCAVATSIPEARATDVTLDGFGFYEVRNRVTYYTRGPKQSGAYRNLGTDYYHKAEYGMDYITNHSGKRSGNISFEFWAMPYYGATSGIILMTRGLDQLQRRLSYEDIDREGLAISVGARRFPELSLWEITRDGWKFRDSLTFSRKTYL